MPFRPLSTELQIKAENDLNEVPSIIQDDLKHIREWLADQPHFTARTDDQWLVGFLRGCKFNLDRVKQKLDLFYTMRTTAPEFFANRDPLLPDIQEMLTFGVCVPLPKESDPTATRTILLRHKPKYNEKIGIMDILKVILMTLDILIMEDDNFVVSGLVAIQDLKEISLRHLLQMTPSNAKKTMTCFLTAYPLRPQQVHFLHTFAAFESVLKIVKLFMSEKLKKRINIYSDDYADNLQCCISPEILPEEYGGKAGPCNDMIKQWKTKVEGYRNWFLEDSKYCSDESKRPQKPNRITEVLSSYKQYFIPNK